MGNRSALIFAALIAILTNDFALAQSNRPPQIIKQAFDSIPDNNGVRSIRIQSAEQKDFYWRNTSVATGYFIIESPSYLGIFSNVSKPAPGATKESLDEPVAGCHYTGPFEVKKTLLESTHRSTDFYWGGGATPFLAITRWNFHKAGAEVVVVEDFLNAKLHGNQGTVALVTDRVGANAVWKATWIDGRAQYEVYQTVSSNGQSVRPDHNVQAFLAMVDRLDCPKEP